VVHPIAVGDFDVHLHLKYEMLSKQKQCLSLKYILFLFHIHIAKRFYSIFHRYISHFEIRFLGIIANIEKISLNYFIEMVRFAGEKYKKNRFVPALFLTPI